MAAQFDLKKSSNGKFFFSLKAGNGQVILNSEMYEARPAPPTASNPSRRMHPKMRAMTV